MASVLRYFTLSKIQHSKFCLNYCKENVTNLIQLFSWQHLAVCTMHIYGRKNTCSGTTEEGKGELLVLPHTWMYIVLCCFSIVFYSLSSLSERWALPEHWSCAAGMCAGESAPWAVGARKALRRVEWRWDEGRWFDLGNQVVLTSAESFWLLQGLSDWEDGSSELTHVWVESSDAGLRRGW